MNIANEISNVKKELRALSKAQLIRMYVELFMAFTQLKMLVEQKEKKNDETNN
jgi:hypothetical protein